MTRIKAEMYILVPTLQKELRLILQVKYDDTCILVPPLLWSHSSRARTSPPQYFNSIECPLCPLCFNVNKPGRLCVCVKWGEGGRLLCVS